MMLYGNDCRPDWATTAKIAALVGGMALLATIPARAEEKSGTIHGEMRFELHNDWIATSDDADDGRNDAYLKVETALEASLTPEFKVKSLLVGEPVQDRATGRDRAFADEGLYAEELYGEYARDRVVIRAGKFGQKFGTAWDAAPGIWGTVLAEDYELAEQLGLAADYHYSVGKGGDHLITLGAFYADNSVLSQSVVTDRGRNRRSAGGAGNTGDLSSFSIALEGEKNSSAVRLALPVGLSSPRRVGCRRNG